MGESARPLAETSVGKNAERVSHELGACEPSISTAGVCRQLSRLAWRNSSFGARPNNAVITSEIGGTRALPSLLRDYLPVYFFVHAHFEIDLNIDSL